MVNIKKELLYKYKKYASNGDILEQGKVECPVTDIDKAVKFMESINYKKRGVLYEEPGIQRRKKERNYGKML